MKEASAERSGWSDGAVIGRFTLVRHLGAGGMGEVWEALDSVLGRRVALKRLLPELNRTSALARLEREAKTQAALSSDHIASIHGLERVERDGETDIFLVIELVEGRTVAEMLEEGALDVDAALSLFAQLCLALQVAHSAGVVHRDLKPSNLLVRENGSLVVVDFGIALRPDDDTDETLTRTGTVIGSTAYLSPQQAAGERVGPESDIWSAGVTFFEMLTGTRPFSGANRAETVAAIIRDEPPAIRKLRPEVPRDVARVIERCLQKDVADRPGDVTEVLDALPAIPIPVAGRRGMIFEPELIARGAAHPPLSKAARLAAPVAALLASLLAFLISGHGWHSEGTWVSLDEVERSSAALLGEVGLEDPEADRLMGYRADAEGRVQAWFRSRRDGFYVERLIPTWDHPELQDGEARLLYDARGHLIRYEWRPDERTPEDGARERIFEAMGFEEGSPALDAALERGHPLRHGRTGEVPFEVAGEGDLVLRLERLDRPLRHIHELPEIHRGRFGGVVLIFVVGLLALFQWRRGRGDVRGAFVFGALFMLLEWARLLALPRMWIDGGWRDLMASSGGAGLFTAALYYGVEPVIRRNWPGLLVGWERLLRWRGRDPVLGREVLLGCAAVLPMMGALWVERAALGHDASLLREVVVPFAGRPGDWITGFGGVVLTSTGFVLSGLLVAAIAHYITRVSWLAMGIGMCVPAIFLGETVAHEGWLAIAASYLLLVALAIRGGMIAQVTFVVASISLAAVLPVSGGREIALYGASTACSFLLLVAAGVWLATKRTALTTSRPLTPAAPQPSVAALPSLETKAQPNRKRSPAAETAAERTKPARPKRSVETETLPGKK